MPPEELLEAAESKSLQIAEMGIAGQTYTLHQAIQEAYDRIDKRHERGHQSISGISTGFLDLDNITAGVRDKEVVIVAAPPRPGKEVGSAPPGRPPPRG